MKSYTKNGNLLSSCPDFTSNISTSSFSTMKGFQSSQFSFEQFSPQLSHKRPPDTATDKNHRNFLDVKSSSQTVLCTTKQTESPSKSFRVRSFPKLKFPLLDKILAKVYLSSKENSLALKILGLKRLRRWQRHEVVIDSSEIRSTTPTGYLSSPISYLSMYNFSPVIQQEKSNIITVPYDNGFIFIQVTSLYQREQLIYSILWRKNAWKFEKILLNSERFEVILKELKNFIDYSIQSTINDPAIYEFVINVVSKVLKEKFDKFNSNEQCQILVTLHPLFEDIHPTPVICDSFTKLCRLSPRSSIINLFKPVIVRILKHSIDYSTDLHLKALIQQYLSSLFAQNDGLNAIELFVKSLHGSLSRCPHPKILHNLFSISVSSICEYKKEYLPTSINNPDTTQHINDTLHIYITIINAMTYFDDWRLHLSVFLQPIPFHDECLSNKTFKSLLHVSLLRISMDDRCSVHQCLLNTRESKPGWLEFSSSIDDEKDIELHDRMLSTLLNCCFYRKKFFLQRTNLFEFWMKLVSIEKEGAMKAICGCIEFDAGNLILKQTMVETLQSSSAGKNLYVNLCERLLQMKELQVKCGPRSLKMPSHSTDADVHQLLMSGRLGNLESLSLAFTRCTNDCAVDLIKLPALKSLNLWSTQFGDSGLELLTEHLSNLQCLNLCETKVTDKGILFLIALKKLKKLNLNSTKLSTTTFENLKEKLPCLREVDIRYTDAWEV